MDPLKELEIAKTRHMQVGRLLEIDRQRRKLLEEMFERTGYDLMRHVCELYRSSRLQSNINFCYQHSIPEFWPRYPKLREPRVIGYCWFDRSPVDTHRLWFQLYEDGVITVGPGYLLPPDSSDILILLGEPSAMSPRIFVALMRRHLQIPREEPDPKPLFSDCELAAVTAAFIAMEAPAAVK